MNRHHILRELSLLRRTSMRVDAIVHLMPAWLLVAVWMGPLLGMANIAFIAVVNEPSSSGWHARSSWILGLLATLCGVAGAAASTAIRFHGTPRSSLPRRRYVAMVAVLATLAIVAAFLADPSAINHSNGGDAYFALSQLVAGLVATPALFMLGSQLRRAKIAMLGHSPPSFGARIRQWMDRVDRFAVPDEETRRALEREAISGQSKRSKRSLPPRRL